MIIIRKDGKRIDHQPKPFDNEEDLKKHLLLNLNVIPVTDVSGDDKNIISWRSEFPLGVGSVDLAAVGDGGGIYLIETKLFKNPEKFLEKLQEKGQGEIPADEEFHENIRQNLRDGIYNILIAMNKVTPQFKDLISFLRKKTDFKVLALDLERRWGNGLEITHARIYGEEISRELPTKEESPWWSPEQLRVELKRFSDTSLKDRLQKMLDWAVDKNLFAQSRGKGPQFSLKSPRGRILWVAAEDGILYAFFGIIERGKYSSDETRYKFVEDLKALGLLPQDINPDEVRSGRNLNKKLNQLTEEEFDKLLELLERHLMATSK